MQLKAQDSIREKPISPQRVNTVIKTNPLPILWGPVPLTAEFRIVREITVATNQSMELGFSYLGKSPLFSILENGLNQNNQVKMYVSGFRLQMAHKFYINEVLEKMEMSDFDYAPVGFYIAPHISYSSAKFTYKSLNRYDVYIRGTHFNINLLGGYQTLIDDQLAIDFFAGMGYKKNTWTEHSPPNNIVPVDMGLGSFYNSNVKLILGFNAGITF